MRIETRAGLIGLLREAAELEHGLCCSYLFAAFSLRVGDPSLPAQHVDVVTSWRKTLIGVAAEEMLHLALVSNLLTSIGSTAHFDRPALPHTSRYYPGGIVISLRRFDEDALSRFMHLERPADMPVEASMAADPDVDMTVAPPDAAPDALTVADEAPVVDDDSLSTVGQLYQAIEDGFNSLARALPHGLFIGSSALQADEGTFGMEDLSPVTDLPSAVHALAVLVHQGEGVRGDWTDAHYGHFKRLRDELRDVQLANPGFDPAWPCAANPIGANALPTDDHTVVTDHDALDAMTLFDGCYNLMITLLSRQFIHGDASGEPDWLAHAALSVMASALGPLGSYLATIPATSTDACTAGAAFTPRRGTDLPVEEHVALQILAEEAQQLAEYAGTIFAEHATDRLDTVEAFLTQLAISLQRAAHEMTASTMASDERRWRR
jgi:hypothetical protein